MCNTKQIVNLFLIFAAYTLHLKDKSAVYEVCSNHYKQFEDMVTQTLSPNWYSMSDPAIVAELCHTLKQVRLQQNLTQGQLAEKAGLSRSAISKIELGKVSVSLLTVVQVLRALQQFHILDSWKVASTISPLAVAKLTSKSRLRASGKANRKNKEESEW